LVLQHAKTIIDRGGATLLLRWFKALPEAWVQSRLKLSLFQAWLLFFTGHLEEVQRKLAELEITLSLPQATLLSCQQFYPAADFTRPEKPYLGENHLPLAVNHQ
jgi:ATP/maltotriose-dependent transcriptional regulator MalT